MVSKFQDTYFLDAKIALETAKQKNRVARTSAVDGLQICYYAGEKLHKTPKNCIHLPLEEVFTYFQTTMNRFPTIISYDNTPFKVKEQKLFSRKLAEIIEAAKMERLYIINDYIRKIRLYQPDFSKPLRIFLPACRETTVMQYAAGNIAKAFKEMGYKAKCYIQKNDMESCCPLGVLKSIYKFKPHITININHLNNHYIHEDVYNFIWYQDPMNVLLSEEKLPHRQRDTYFIYLNEWKDLLVKKGIEPDAIYPQYSCINKDDFFIDDKVTRENKIVFAGTYYTNEYIQLMLPFINQNINKKLYSLIEDGIDFSSRNISKVLVADKVNFIDKDILYIQQMYIRNKTIAWIIEICHKLNFDLELYGWAGDKHQNKNIQKYYKGSLPHSEMKNLYNSSKYTLLSSGRTINTQRLAESAACGSIPVIFDSRNITLEEETWDNEVLYFKSKKELKNILKRQLEPKKNFKKIAKALSYRNLAKKVLGIYKKEHKKVMKPI